MIQDDIDEIEPIINFGDAALNYDCSQTHYLEAIAKTQLLILREIGTV